jgi:hypothetical protein
MLSTRFGYGRPAFLARRFAAAFCAEFKPSLAARFFRGAGRSHGGRFFLVAIACLR